MAAFRAFEIDNSLEGFGITHVVDFFRKDLLVHGILCPDT